MEKEMKIVAPDGYEIDKENSTFECVKFKKSENKPPMSWEDIREIGGWYVTTNGLIAYHNKDQFPDDRDKNLFPSKEEAKAMLAMAQLCQLRDVWNEGWKPDFKDGKSLKYCIEVYGGKIINDSNARYHKPMSFKTSELRDKFFRTFKELLEIAKPFL